MVTDSVRAPGGYVAGMGTTELTLANLRTGPEWGVKVASALVRNNTLIQLSMRNNRLDAHAGEALLKAYTHNKYIMEVTSLL